MLLTTTTQTQKRRRRVKAPVANRILRVSHTAALNKLSVIVSGQLSDLDFTQAMQAFDGTSWHSSSGGNLDNLPEVDISFGVVHVNTATQWRIVDPSVWEFEDGRPLVGTGSGSIS